VKTTIRMVILWALISACGQPSSGEGGAGQGPSLEGADSIVLERGPCPTCPEYRLSVARSGRVEFQLRNHADGDMTAVDSVPPSAFSWLLGEAERAGIARLPAVVQNDQDLCPVYATNAPVVAISIHAADDVTRVIHYTGCAHADGRAHWRPAQLEAAMAFYSAVDSVAGADRWIPEVSIWDAVRHRR
jgi:hypothetical protein